MATLFIPAALRRRTAGRDRIETKGTTVAAVLRNADAEYPGIWDDVTEANDLRPELALAVDGEISDDGLLAPVRPTSEIHIVPALAGGSPSA